ncbi:uncharacterized protein LOC117342310 [Pecten maximus]|uniref:uncharacterized protein LOC117342310 n=1 Tax=Pecten maximus TaxID=6579 RepID=UPI00145895C5|nr:uncharacterized protein LOC117342310 [Pecten maximus]
MKMKGCINSFCLAVIYNIICRVSPIPYCKDQWSNAMPANTSTSEPCKIEQKTGSAVDMYCDVDSTKFSSISWYHKLRGSWVPIVMDYNPEWYQTVYLTNSNRNLTLLSTYIDDSEEDYYFSYNNNTNGTYKCEANQGSVPDATRIIELDLYECAVRKHVLVHITMKDKLTNLGGTVKSSCVADYGCRSGPPYSADWYLRQGFNYTKVADLKGTRYHVKTAISNAGRHIVTTLTIDDVQKVDFGDNFVCIVSNSSNSSTEHPLHIKRVDVVRKQLPFPVMKVMIPVIFLVLFLILAAILGYKRHNIRLFILSRCYDNKHHHTNKIFILLDEEEEMNKKEGIFEDRKLALEITRKFEKYYEVATSYTCCDPGQDPAEGQNVEMKSSSTIFVILPDYSNVKRFREMDSQVSCLCKTKDICLRYLTIIDRHEAVPSELKYLYSLSKSLVHVKRPQKQDTDSFYKKLKQRTSPLPKEPKYQPNHLRRQLCCCCIRDKNHQVYVVDDTKLVDVNQEQEKL